MNALLSITTGPVMGRSTDTDERGNTRSEHIVNRVLRNSIDDNYKDFNG